MKSKSSNVMKISIISDTHLLPRDMIADNTDFKLALGADRKMFTESEFLLNKVVDLVIKNQSSALFLSGDMTKDGEYKSHARLIETTKKFLDKSKENRLFVVPGNHDINSKSSMDYNFENTGKSHITRRTTPEDFLNLYYDTVYEKALELYKDSDIFKAYLNEVNERYERKDEFKYYAQGFLSYVSRMEMNEKSECGLTVIGLDTIKYSIDCTLGKSDDNREVSGTVSVPLLKWTAKKAKEATKRGDVVVVIAHHAFIPHFYDQDKYLAPYVIDNWNKKIEDDDENINGKTPAEVLADSGINFIFTGHMHAQDICKMATKSKNTIYDIETGSTVTFPLPVRHLVLENDIDRNTLSLDVKTEFIKEFSYKNLEGKIISVDDAQNYSSGTIITADVIAGTCVYLLSSPEIVETGSKKLFIKFASNKLNHLNDENYYKLIQWALTRYMGTKENPGIVTKLKRRIFYKPELKLYYGDIENTKKYGKGKKLAIDVIINGERFPFMIREENLLELIERMFKQIDNKIFSEPEKTRKWVKYLMSYFLSYPILEDNEKYGKKTLSDLINCVYKEHIHGEEKKYEWVEASIEKLQKKNLIFDMIVNHSKDGFDAIIPEVMSEFQYDPNPREMIEFDGNGKKFSPMRNYVKLSIRNSLGKNFYSSLKNTGYTNYELLELISKKEDFINITEIMNTWSAGIVRAMSDEGIEEYKDYAYKEDNNTYIKIEKQLTIE